MHFALTFYLPFAEGMHTTERIALSILGATILLALSPPSAIAVIKETGASGPFTSAVPGITVSMDVLIVVLFAVAVAVASAFIHQTGFNLSFAGLLLIDLGGAAIVGLLVGKFLQVVYCIGTFCGPFWCDLHW